MWFICVSGGGASMKILYGIQGTGNGHITRARVMASCFKKLNVEVDYVFSGRANTCIFYCLQAFHLSIFSIKRQPSKACVVRKVLHIKVVFICTS